jgi:hypothetical protein
MVLRGAATVVALFPLNPWPHSMQNFAWDMAWEPHWGQKRADMESEG